MKIHRLSISNKMLWAFLALAGLLLLSTWIALGAPASGPTQPPAPDRSAGRTIPAPQASGLISPSGAQEYCSSFGGSTAYEYISSVTLTPNTGGTMQLTVQVFIANPQGCVAGEECPSYDPSPEYVNAWIDWNGDQVWDESERVMDRALTGYQAINYRGTMTAVTQFVVPASAVQEHKPTQMRANLGWSFDPNDPCEGFWTWGNVVDQLVHPGGPEITNITAKGVGTPGEQPQTGKPVRMEADINVPAGYELLRCSWSGDLTPGEGDKNNKCRFDYTPVTGAGPDVTTYGEKNVTLLLTYRHTATNLDGQTQKDHTYKVFFEKGSPGSWGDDDNDGEPNWFEYWKDDSAVSQLSPADVFYDQTLGNNTYGYWDPADDNIHVGGAAAQTHYPSGLNVPAVASTCPGGNFGNVKGIDSAAEVLVHERRHETINHNWNAGGTWAGLTDSDQGVPSAGFDDDLPDTYETTAGTRNDNVDSCDLATHKSATYNTYGDNEFDAMNTSNGSTGTSANDWANPGKQSNPPFLAAASAETGLGAANGSSGRPAALLNWPGEGAASRMLAATLSGFTGSYSSSGVDTDANAVFESLKLSVGLQIDQADEYNVVAYLENAGGNPVAWAQSQQALSAGVQTMDLFFDSVDLRASGYNGPYTVAHIELRAGEEEVLLAAADNVHTSAAYNLSSFEPPAAYLNGATSDSGIDTIGDSLYDVLRVAVGVSVQKAGTYEIAGELAAGSRFATAHIVVTLAAGAHTVNLDFDGRSVYFSGKSGPYVVQALRVLDATGETLDYVETGHTTAAYTRDQFVHSSTFLHGDLLTEETLDADGDGDVDYLRISVPVTVGVGDKYRLLAGLKDANGAAITQIAQDLNSPFPQDLTVVLDFPAGPIHDHGVDGTYQLVPISLLNEAGEIVDVMMAPYITQSYLASQFSSTLVSLGSVFTESVTDLDHNGKYERLVIGFTVTLGDAGVTGMQVRLTNGAGQTIQWLEGFQALPAGASTVYLYFDGGVIRDSGLDGPYQVRDLLVYHTGDPGQSQSVALAKTTAAYLASDFEAPLNVLYLPMIER